MVVFLIGVVRCGHILGGDGWWWLVVAGVDWWWNCLGVGG